MAIEITEFANASISVSPAGAASGDFGILGFLTNEAGISPAIRSRSYTGLASVGNDWDATSEVYKAATAFYSQTPTPTTFVVLSVYETDQPATLVGGAGSDTIAELNNITAGNFNITIDGIPVAIDDLDLSSAITMADVATDLESAITAENGGALCTVTSGDYGLEIKSLVSGGASTITYAEGTVGLGSSDAAIALGFAQHQGKISEGIDAETPVDALATSLSMGRDFTGLVTAAKYRDKIGGAAGTNTRDIAAWAEGAKKIFCNTSNDLAVLNAAIDTDVASVLMSMSLRFTLTTFSKDVGAYPSASVFGRAASVNFAAEGSTLTLNLKQMPTIVAEDLTPAEFTTLRSKNASAVVRIGKTNNAFTDSKMASGTWLDTTHGLLWLENRIEVDMFNLLYRSTTKVPYTQSGINTTVSTLDRSLQAAVRNNLCAPGYLPDGRYLPEGYLISQVPLEDTPASDKSVRQYFGLSFEMTGAGAMHGVSVTGGFTE